MRVLVEMKSLTLIHNPMFDKNRKNPQADLSAGGEGGLLLPSGVVLPPLISLHLEVLLGLTLNEYFVVIKV